MYNINSTIYINNRSPKSYLSHFLHTCNIFFKRSKFVYIYINESNKKIIGKKKGFIC